MTQELEQIEYRQGMLEKGMKPNTLPVKIWRGAEIPADVRAAISAESLLSLGGVYGNKKAGDPMEYDYLKLILTDGVILNIAPLWELLPWNEPKKYWEELQEGKYDWSHIAYQLWPERVKEACKKNRSIAIAYGAVDRNLRGMLL